MFVHNKIKLEDQLKKQLDLLKNNMFSVLYLNRKTEKGTLLNKNWNTVLNKEDVLSFRNVLLNKNKANCDIYIKAESGDYYNIVIDDLTKERKDKLLTYVFCDLIIASSENNYQAIINLSKKDFSKKEADFITKYLNEIFGDENFSGSNHYFRLVTFNNKKPKNKNELVNLVDFKNIKSEQENLRTFKIIVKNLEQKEKEEKTKAFISKGKIEKEEINNEAREKIAKELMEKELAFCQKRFKNLDFSAVDFRIVKRLYKNGFTDNEIAYLFLKYNDFETRHKAPDDYLQRTIRKAILEFEEEKQQQSEKAKKKLEG